MKPESNGPVAPPSADGTDPLAEAEALRGLLADAAVRAGRLVAAHKLKKKESKALNQVWSSLKSLNLNP